MYCYDTKGDLLGVIDCIPKIGEEHMWGDDLYVCIDYATKYGAKSGMVFQKIN